MFPLLLAADTLTGWQLFFQQCINGLTYGALIALIALGYTMVYGIIGLINFAHGDLFMLGTMLTLSLTGVWDLDADSGGGSIVLGIAAVMAIVAVFCAALNLAVDRIVYKPLRRAPKLAPLVSAIGVSFIFQNIGMMWKGAADLDVPDWLGRRNDLFDDSPLNFTQADLTLFIVVFAVMLALTLIVKFTRLGKAMRATAQNPVAAQLMGIHVERVIAGTFVIGGALAGIAAVILPMHIGTTNYQIGYITGLYAFTAAVLGGIGNIPGAVLGGLVIGMVRSLGSGYLGERWSGALIFGMLILILVFRPAGLLGVRVREKV